MLKSAAGTLFYMNLNLKCQNLPSMSYTHKGQFGEICLTKLSRKNSVTYKQSSRQNRIASVTSCLNENEARNLQNGDVHLAQIPDFKMRYLENHLAH